MAFTSVETGTTDTGTAIADRTTNMAAVAIAVACGVTNARTTGVEGVCSTSACSGGQPSELAGASYSAASWKRRRDSSVGRSTGSIYYYRAWDQRLRSIVDSPISWILRSSSDFFPLRFQAPKFIQIDLNPSFLPWYDTCEVRDLALLSSNFRRRRAIKDVDVGTFQKIWCIGLDQQRAALTSPHLDMGKSVLEERGVAEQRLVYIQ